MSSDQPVAIPRQQVGIERLPARRTTNEPRESMNCKSCRKRKIKCNRLRPACEACQIFQCPCVYDAVPKKRGPKTDVLEALLKRVDGLEAKLREQNSDETSNQAANGAEDDAWQQDVQDDIVEPPSKRQAIEHDDISRAEQTAVVSSNPSNSTKHSSPRDSTIYLDTYFSKFHAKPFQVIDESSVRQRLQLNQLPPFVFHAIAAVGARHTPHPRGIQAAAKLSEEFAMKARSELDVDEPSIDSLQTAVLLVIAFTASGKGKKAFMLLTIAVGMAMALELHREMDLSALVTPMEREVRRRLFWTCYLFDRFLACGSKRPSIINDKTIMLRLPSWSPSGSGMLVDGEFFQSSSNLQFYQSTGKKSQGSSGMLIDINRILGITNRYLAAGGVKGDSHFPWHSLSNLSKIRQELDMWASGTENVFGTADVLFSQPDASILVFSKLVFHLIHCLIYRPFLPIDLAELAGTGQHQSWQIEATNLCFLHANAIAELIDMGNQTNNIQWPAFVGYCVCTAGTVHVHGAYYSKQGENSQMNVFGPSADFLSREMQQLGELRYSWAIVQHQRETLQAIYNAHAELVKTVRGNSMSYTPGFHLEDFFDRYANIEGPGGQTFHFDAANLSLADVTVDFSPEAHPRNGFFYDDAQDVETSEWPTPLKRRNTGTGSSIRKPRERDSASTMQPPPSTAGLASQAQSYQSSNTSTTTQSSPTAGPLFNAMSSNVTSMPSDNTRQQLQMGEAMSNNLGGNTPSGTIMDGSGLGTTPNAGPFSLHTPGRSSMPNHILPSITGTGFSPAYSFGTTQPSGPVGDANAEYDPMFGGVPTNAFTSPAAWQGDDNQSHTQAPSQNQAQTQKRTKKQPPGIIVGGSGTSGPPAESPSQQSNNGSTGTAQPDEADPFLRLLEQLAENEQHFGNGMGSDLDFFLGGGAGSGVGGGA